MQLDTYAFRIYRRYRSFLSCSRLFTSIDVHKVSGRKRERERGGAEGKEEKGKLRDCKSSRTLRLRAFMTSTSHRGGNFSDRICDELSSLFFPETRLRSGASVSGLIKGMTTAWPTSKIEISRTAPGVRARIIINATTFIAALERIIESLSAAATGPFAFHPDCNEKKAIFSFRGTHYVAPRNRATYMKVKRLVINIYNRQA